MSDTIRSDEVLTLETSALKLITVANLRYKLSWDTKLPCYTLPPTQRHNFSRNLTPLNPVNPNSD